MGKEGDALSAIRVAMGEESETIASFAITESKELSLRTVRIRVAPEKLLPSRSALEKSTSIRMAPEKSAPRRLALIKERPVKFALRHVELTNVRSSSVRWLSERSSQQMPFKFLVWDLSIVVVSFHDVFKDLAPQDGIDRKQRMLT